MAIATAPLKLPDTLTSRIANAAEAAGKSAHAFMPALIAREEVTQYGLAYDADEVFSHIQALVEGKQAERPTPVKA